MNFKLGHRRASLRHHLPDEGRKTEGGNRNGKWDLWSLISARWSVISAFLAREVFGLLLHWPRPVKWPRLFHRTAFEISAFSVSTFQLFDLVNFNFLLSTFCFKNVRHLPSDFWPVTSDLWPPPAGHWSLISAFCLPNFCFDFVLSQFLFLILRFQLFRDGVANFYCSTPEFILISITYASAEGVKYLFVFNH